MIAVSLSVLLLFAAPMVTRVLGSRPALASGVDGFVLMLAFGLVMLVILPEVVSHLGLFGLGLMIVGLLLPSLAERVLHRSVHQTHQVSMITATIAMVLHAGTDGLLLATTDRYGDAAVWVIFSLLLHRFAVGATLWWLLRPYFSRFARYMVMIAMAIATLLFYALSDQVIELGQYGDTMDASLAFAGGGLLHIVLHPQETSQSSGAGVSGMVKRSHQVGTAFGLAFVAAMVGAQSGGHAIPGGLSGHTHHGMGAFIESALHLAPWFLTLAGGWMLLGLLGITKGIAAGLEGAIKLSLALWFACAIGSFVLPGLFNEHGHGSISISVIIWVALVMLVLTRLGARDFLACVVPARFMHAHSDAH